MKKEILFIFDCTKPQQKIMYKTVIDKIFTSSNSEMIENIRLIKMNLMKVKIKKKIL